MELIKNIPYEDEGGILASIFPKVDQTDFVSLSYSSLLIPHPSNQTEKEQRWS